MNMLTQSANLNRQPRSEFGDYSGTAEAITNDQMLDDAQNAVRLALDVLAVCNRRVNFFTSGAAVDALGEAQECVERALAVLRSA